MNLLEVRALLIRLLHLSLEGSLRGGEGDDSAVEHLEIGTKRVKLLQVFCRILGARLCSLSLVLRSLERRGGGCCLFGIGLGLRLSSCDRVGVSLGLLQSCLEGCFRLVGISLSLGLGLSGGCSLVGVSLGFDFGSFKGGGSLLGVGFSLSVGRLLLVLESLKLVGHVGEVNLQLLSLGGVCLLGLVGGGERRVRLSEGGIAILGSLQLISGVLLSLGELVLSVLLLLLEFRDGRFGRLRGGLGRGHGAGGRRELSLELFDLVLELLEIGFSGGELGRELLLSRGGGRRPGLVSLGGGSSLGRGSLPLSLHLALQLGFGIDSRGEGVLRVLERRGGLFLVGVALGEEVGLEFVLGSSERSERGFRLVASFLNSLGEIGFVLGPVRLASLPLGIEDGLELGILGIVPLHRSRIGLGGSLLLDLLALLGEFLLEHGLLLLNLPGGVLNSSLLRGDGLVHLPVRRLLGLERLAELRLELIHLLFPGLDLIREFLLEHGLLLRDLRKVALNGGSLRLSGAQGRLELSLLLEDLVLEFLDLGLRFFSKLLELSVQPLDLLGGCGSGGLAADSHLLELIRSLDGVSGELSLFLRRRALEHGELLRDGVLRSLDGGRLLVGDAVRALLGGECLLEVGCLLLVSLGVFRHLLVELSLLRRGGLAVIREGVLELLVRLLSRVDGDA